MPPREFGLYFLIFPDAPAAARIAALARRCRSEHGLRAKPLPTSRFHVSLQNLGRYGELTGPKIAAAKARDAAARVRACPFVVMFSRVESFSGRDGHHPLVLRGDDGVVGLEMLNRSLGATMRMTGFESRLDFTPHVTLLYGDRHIGEQRIEPIRWVVREFALVLSLIGRTKYILLDRWQLGG